MTKKLSFSSVLVLLGLLSTAPAFAAPLSNEALYFRCYGRLTGLRPLESDPVLAAVRAGTTQAITACLEMLEKAKLTANSETTIVDTVTGSQVLSHMHQIHTTFFGTRGINLPNANDNQKAINYDIIDPTAPALFYTKALFKNNVRADSLITGKQNLRAIRTDNDPVKSILTTFLKSTYAYALFPENNFRLLSSGDLKGIESSSPETYKFFPLEYLPTPSPAPAKSGETLYAEKCASCHQPLASSTKKNRYLATVNKSLTSVTTMKNLGLTPAEVTMITKALQVPSTLTFGDSEGGGYMGSHAYLMKTVDQDITFVSNLLSLPRRWSRSIFHDALCRDLPLIRVEDGASFEQPSSAIPFRQSKTCTQCHATMDRAASTLRGFTYFSPPLNLNNHRVSVHYNMTPVTKPSESGWPAVQDDSFHQRPPTGTFYYRTASSGALVNVPVNSLEELGQAMATQDDFYICLANRYWDFLSGKGVKMDDQAIMNGYPATERTRFEKIKNWGIALKNRPDQSLRWLLEQMLTSPEFADSAYGP